MRAFNVFIIILITLSGFGQMPIFKRYYIADIPGFGWLAQFYVTHLIHYLAAACLTAIFFFMLSQMVLGSIVWGSVTRVGWAGGASLLGLIVTGCLLVVKNLNGVYWPHGLIIGLDLLHLGFCMLFLGSAVYTGIGRKKWIDPACEEPGLVRK